MYTARRRTLVCAAKAGGSATSSRDAPVPRKEPGNDDARAALLELSAAFAALPASFLDRISADQNRDLRDSCYELKTAGPGREVDPAMGSLLTELAEAVYDQGDGLKASHLASRLELPRELQSPSRSALARRLIGAARYAGMFERTLDAESDAALVAMAQALSQAALALAAGTKEENATKAALLPPTQRQLTVGPVTVSVTAYQAAVGAGIAYTLAYCSSRLTGIYNGDPNVQFAAAVKAAEAAEIRLILQNTVGDLIFLVGNGCTILSTVVGSVLLFIAWQLVEENFDDMEGRS